MKSEVKMKAAAEAAKMAGFVTILYFLVRLFFWGAQRGMGAPSQLDELVLFAAAGLFAAAFLAAYVYYVVSLKTGKASYYVIPYRSLAGMEEQLNIRGNQGFRCENARPDLFLFRLRYTGEHHYYRAEYVTVRDALHFKQFIKENSEQGWQYVPSSNSVGSTPVAVFTSAEPSADVSAAGHNVRNLRGWLVIVIVLNVLASAFAILVAVYVLPGVAIARWFAGVVSAICILQILVKLRVAFLPEK